MTKQLTVIHYVQLDWLVLDERGGKTLIIAKDITEKHAFHDTRFCFAWEESALKSHLAGGRFLLDKDEAAGYFADDSSRVATFNGEPRAWWLRSLDIKNHAAFVSKDGVINTHGYRVDCSWCGVRPALWISAGEI